MVITSRRKKIMVYQVNVKTQSDFDGIIDRKDLRISLSIVEQILKNLKTKRQHVHVLSVLVEDDDNGDGAIYDITCSRKDFVDTLTKNLKILEYHEYYEKCVDVKKAIEFLKQKS